MYKHLLIFRYSSQYCRTEEKSQESTGQIPNAFNYMGVGWGTEAALYNVTHHKCTFAESHVSLYRVPSIRESQGKSGNIFFLESQGILL